jgi:putative tryptophan/tyrosine transport system substrate-binding protein
MRRRKFISLIGGAAAASSLWPLAGQAQQGGPMRRVGVLMSYAEGDAEAKARIGAFEQALRELGWTNGRNVEIVYRFGGGIDDRQRAYASELVSRQPDVLVAQSASSLAPLAQATRTIPIVVATVGDLVESGYVQSFAHPGGNITGFTAFELAMGGKWLDLLHEVAPTLSRVMVVENPNPQRASYLPSIEAAARSIHVTVTQSDLHSPADIGPAIDRFAKQPDGGLIVMPSGFTAVHRHDIIAAAARNLLPAIYPFRYFTDDGGLIVYGSDGRDIFRRTAGYVDRILKGESPANLPVQQPIRFEMIVNLKTAKAQGLTIPESFLLRADEVIE